MNVVHGRDIVSWGAVDRNRSDGLSDQLIGFVTARLVMAKGSDVSSVSALVANFAFNLSLLVEKIENHD